MARKMSSRHPRNLNSC